MGAQVTKLVDSNAPPHVNVISRLHVSPESRMTAHDQVVPYSAIVGDVRVRQEKIFGTDRGGIAVLGRRMSRDVFPENVSVTDSQARRTALVFEVMSLAANQGIGEHLVAFAHDDVALHRGMMPQHAIATQNNLLSNEAKCADLDVLAKLSPWFDYG